MKRTAIICLLFICAIATNAQMNPPLQNTDSCTMEISLLTCVPGTDLYSLFGHTAIRVLDTRRGMDIVYNYGTFDDTDPMFYVKFMRGIMNYSISAETFPDFMAEYQYEHRAVVAQLLNLTCKEKSRLYEALRKNTLEENRFYAYHFHTDNCTTRAARIIESNTEEPLSYMDISEPTASAPHTRPSYRDMIHEYLYRQNQYWSAFGIDMLLGAHLDAIPTNVEAIHFLPDYLFRGMDSANTGNKRVVSGKKTLLNFPALRPPREGFTPMALFQCLLLMTIILFIFKQSAAIAKTLLIFDIVFFSLLGLLGILMAVMWLGRVDDVCRDNINILWALPTHIVAVFFIRKKFSWVKYYFLVTTIIALILGIGFLWWPQKMNPAVLPLLGIIIFRGFYLFQIRNHVEKPAVQG